MAKIELEVALVPLSAGDVRIGWVLQVRSPDQSYDNLLVEESGTLGTPKVFVSLERDRIVGDVAAFLKRANEMADGVYRFTLVES